MTENFFGSHVLFLSFQRLYISEKKKIFTFCVTKPLKKEIYYIETKRSAAAARTGGKKNENDEKTVLYSAGRPFRAQRRDCARHGRGQKRRSDRHGHMELCRRHVHRERYGRDPRSCDRRRDPGKRPSGEKGRDRRGDHGARRQRVFHVRHAGIRQSAQVSADHSPVVL